MHGFAGGRGAGGRIVIGVRLADRIGGNVRIVGAAGGRGQGLAALLPLLRSTVDNLETAGLPAALTGPLVRGDRGTVARHLAALAEAAPEVAAVYRALGLAALGLVSERGELDADALTALRTLLDDNR